MLIVKEDNRLEGNICSHLTDCTYPVFVKVLKS